MVIARPCGAWSFSVAPAAASRRSPARWASGSVCRLYISTRSSGAQAGRSRTTTRRSGRRSGWRSPATPGITDGNYVGRTFDLRLPRADTVIFVDQPRRVCLWRIFNRWWTDRGKRRADLAEGCYENLDWDFTQWVWTFERKSRPRIEASVASYGKPMITLTGDGEVAAFLRALPTAR
jgi:hypothetical protein